MALAVPVLATLFVAATVYLPGLFVQPKYDFLYSVGDYDSTYQVSQNKLQSTPAAYELDIYWREPAQPPKLFTYDIAANQSREISLEEASALELDDNRVSPDGFEVVNTFDSGSWFFNYQTQNEWFLKGQNTSRKLHIQDTGGYTPVDFIGWIKE